LLTIRKEQLDVFGREVTPRFEVRALTMVEQQYQEDYAALGRDGVLDLVRYTASSGAKHGIHAEGALNGLLQLYIEFGRQLELAPYRHWALQILSHPRLPGPLKVSLIRSRLLSLTQGRRMVRHTEEEPV
jgi:hypothetical protein